MRILEAIVDRIIPKPKTRLTAQEALEREGFILVSSTVQRAPGDIVLSRERAFDFPKGTPVVIQSEISFSEALTYCDRCNWPRTDLAGGTRFYLASVE